jgi:chromatin remodeling complex protein RSC6
VTRVEATLVTRAASGSSLARSEGKITIREAFQREKPRISGGFQRENAHFAIAPRSGDYTLQRVRISAPTGDYMATAKKKSTAKKSSAKKAAPRKAAAKKSAPAKKATKKTSARKPNAAFMKAMQPDAELSAVVGNKPMPRTEVTKKLWAYIKKNDLQDAKERRMINADENLKPIFNGKKQVSMFDMTKLVNKHLKDA